MTEPQVIRRNPRFSSALLTDQTNQECSLSDPNWYVPFVDDKDYILADAKDRLAVLVCGGISGAFIMAAIITCSENILNWLKGY